MNFYSTKLINIVSLIITIFIFLFINFYVPKAYITIKEFVYYKIQPTNYQDY